MDAIFGGLFISRPFCLVIFARGSLLDGEYFAVFYW